MEAGGVGIFSAIENTELVDFSRRSKRRKRQNCATGTYLEREIFSPISFSGNCVILPSDWAYGLPTSQNPFTDSSR